MTILFPFDFTITENPCLRNATNYLHIRENGSFIFILENPNKPGYEVWDDKYMDDIQIMSYEELYQYLQKEPTRDLLSNICLN